MTAILILLAVLSAITICLYSLLAVWLWQQHNVWCRVGAGAAIVAALCLVAVWILLYCLRDALPAFPIMVSAL